MIMAHKPRIILGVSQYI